MKRIKNRQQGEWYDMSTILEQHCQYNLIFGERSNGKTYSVLRLSIRKFWEEGGETAIVRRWDTDFMQGRSRQVFDSIITDGVVTEVTGGKWTGITYYNRRWYFSKRDEDGGIERHERPFAYAFALGGAEHDKGASFPNVTTILFDEFLARTVYLPDEFILFMNTVSTIVRFRDNVTIFMLGNTVNQYCPYFQEMGLTHARTMEQGTIDVYQFGEQESNEERLKVAVEFVGALPTKKPSNKYFAFNNPRLKMITSGVWEVAMYPHLPVKYKPKEVVFTYFIQFVGDILQCEIIQTDNSLFTYIHRKTTPIKDEETDIVYSPEISHRPNWRRRLTKGKDKIDRTVHSFFLNEKVFYQDNTVGEIVRNYLLWCGTSLIQN